MSIERINLITQDELNDIADINSKCQKLHMMPPAKIELQLDVFGADGEHKKEIKQLSKSWNRNFYNWMFSQLTGLTANSGGTTFEAGKLPIKNILGTVFNNGSNIIPTSSNGIANYVGIAGNHTKGIVIGTGTDAENFEGFALQTPIINGNGSGEMAYSAQEATTMTYDAGTKVMTATLIRYINNNSGGVINVSEIGWYIYLIGTAVYCHMVSRDLQSPAVDVLDGEQLKVTYTISVTYPA